MVRNPLRLNFLVSQTVVGGLISMVTKLPNHHTKVIGFNPLMVAYAYLQFAPPERGGQGDFKAKAIQEAARSGRPVNDVAENVRTINLTASKTPR